MMSTPESKPDQRLTRILDRLIERTEADDVEWEYGAPGDSYAVTIADLRFRIRTRDGNEQPPYILEVMGPVSASIEDDVERLTRLYVAGRRSAIAHAPPPPDPLRDVEQQLGLTEPNSGSPDRPTAAR